MGLGRQLLSAKLEQRHDLIREKLGRPEALRVQHHLSDQLPVRLRHGQTEREGFKEAVRLRLKIRLGRFYQIWAMGVDSSHIWYVLAVAADPQIIPNMRIFNHVTFSNVSHNVTARAICPRALRIQYTGTSNREKNLVCFLRGGCENCLICTM